MRLEQSRLVVASLLVVLIGSLTLADAPRENRRDTRMEVKAMWDSLETFKFRCDVVRIDKSGTSTPERGHLRYEMMHGTGGRWALTSSSMKTGKPEIMESFREDGRRHYDINFLGRNPSWMSRILVQPQTSYSDRYTNTMFCMTWLLMPGGQSVSSHLEAGAVLEEKQENGHKVVVMSTKFKGQPLRCVLDPDRDWLLNRVELGDLAGKRWSTWEATRFSLVNGRWFPIEGRTESLADGEKQQWGFTVSDLTVNESINPSAFAMPTPTSGVTVLDETTKNKVVKGGPKAQEELTRRFLQQEPKSANAQTGPRSPPAAPLVASQRPDQFPWSIVLAGISTVVMISAVGLRFWIARNRG